MRAVALTAYGAPDVLVWQQLPDPEPGPTEVRVRVRGAGVGPTDLHIRAGHLQHPFPLTLPAILGFEAAGTVDAVGAEVEGVAVGDDVAVLLRDQGGYAELVVSDTWVAKPAAVGWDAAAALPASAEAAVGVLRELGIRSGEHLVVLGAGGSVGLIGVQVALSMGVHVVGVAHGRDEALLTGLGATFVPSDVPLVEGVRAVSGSVDAVMDAAGIGQLEAAITLAGGAERVVTLSDPTAASLGARLSAPGPDRAPDALDVVMPLLAAGTLTLKPRTTMPLEDAARAHEAMEAAGPHQKIVLLHD